MIWKTRVDEHQPVNRGTLRLDPAVADAYLAAVHRHQATELARIDLLERFAFYERAKTAFAVVMTGDTAKYGNVILKKGLCGKGRGDS